MLNSGVINVDKFMKKAVYWTVVLKSKKLLLKNPDEFEKLNIYLYKYIHTIYINKFN